jgi:hypothetical protein
MSISSFFTSAAHCPTRNCADLCFRMSYTTAWNDLKGSAQEWRQKRWVRSIFVNFTMWHGNCQLEFWWLCFKKHVSYMHWSSLTHRLQFEFWFTGSPQQFVSRHRCDNLRDCSLPS